MPVKLKTYQKQIQHLKVDLTSPGEDPGTGEQLSVTYNRGAMTTRLTRIITRAREDDEATPALIEMLIHLLESWDFVGEDSKPLPINPDSMEDIPLWILLKILESINEDSAPNMSRNGNTAPS